ncbi:MAG: hypothetical protein H6618_02060 [Deltaproteobacteria bacterium]|nr:hypothetical protein [Deltaproteobacteria bacterium]
MHELSCPSCNAPSQYDLKDHILMCPFCSVSFRLNMENGKKEIYSDHYIVPNACDTRQIKNIMYEWLKRLHHQADSVDKEYYITDINGYSIPYWIISLEAHTMWKGLVRKPKGLMEYNIASNSIQETGQFRRNYRWAVSARSNICERWGMTLLHEPKEQLDVTWDGFPLDSTLSRGRIEMNLGVKKSKDSENEELSAYDVREFFEFKYANGLPILTIQVSDEEALRRTRSHVLEYHHKLARISVDVLIDHRTELEIAGIQLIHLPFWHGRYIYQPRSLLKHFHTPKEKNVILEGYSGGILKGELAIVKKDKLWVNAIICASLSLFSFILGILWHGAFMLIAAFLLIVAFASGYMAMQKAAPRNRLDRTTFIQEGSTATAAKTEKTS